VTLNGVLCADVLICR